MRIAIGALLAIIGFAFATDSRAVRFDDGPILILYVGAEDCAPCRIWRRDHRPGLIAGMDRNRLHYREVIAPRTVDAFSDATWPDDLRSYVSEAKAVGGVPLWLVVREKRVLARAGGLSEWEKRVRPLIKNMALKGL